MLLAVFYFSSCKKEEIIVGDLAFVAGDYEWVYSVNNQNTEFYTTQETPNEFGIRITSDDRIYLFIDGKEEHRYRITTKIVNETQQSISFKKGRNNFSSISISGDTIWTYEMPYLGLHNYYIKIR